MVKQTNALLNKRNPQFLRSVKTGLVILAARGRGDVLHARAASAEDVVDEGEL